MEVPVPRADLTELLDEKLEEFRAKSLFYIRDKALHNCIILRRQHAGMKSMMAFSKKNF